MTMVLPTPCKSQVLPLLPSSSKEPRLLHANLMMYNLRLPLDNFIRRLLIILRMLLHEHHLLLFHAVCLIIAWNPPQAVCSSGSMLMSERAP